MFLAKSAWHKYGQQHVPVMNVDIVHPSCLEGIIDMGGGVGWRLLSKREGEKLEPWTIISYSKIILNRSKAAVKT